MSLRTKLGRLETLADRSKPAKRGSRSSDRIQRELAAIELRRNPGLLDVESGDVPEAEYARIQMTIAYANSQFEVADHWETWLHQFEPPAGTVAGIDQQLQVIREKHLANREAAR